jgi:hypothetical protein
MSRLRKTGLTIDDPLAPVTAKTEGRRAARPSRGTRFDSSPRRPEADVAIPKANSSDAAAGAEEAVGVPESSDDPAAGMAADGVPERSPRRRAARMEASRQPAGVWRSWSGGTRVASYRLPDELLAELGSTSAELQLQVGLIVTAAITRLLDEPDEVIASLVDRADDARIQGRRAARRGPGTTSRPRSASEAGATL